MRDLLLLLLFLGAVFFAVGEWNGWYLGLPPQTPIFVYKKDYTANTTRRTVNSESLHFGLSGEVRRGAVTVSVFFERPYSIQTGREAVPEVKVFERSFDTGEQMNIDHVVEQGRGIYRVQMAFEDATGLFRMRLPSSAQL